MSRLIVAPVGGQPAAVLCPLLSPPLRPRLGDRVVLVETAYTTKNGYGAAISWHLRREIPGLEVDTPSTDPATRLDETCRAMLQERVTLQDEVWVLVNGGLWPLALDVIDFFWLRDEPLRLAASRDHVLTVIDPRTGTPEAHTVADVGLDALCTLLGVEQRDGTLLKRDVEISGVESLLERAGFLFAALTPEPLEDVGTYRRYVLDYDRLHRVGLEQRRIFVLATGEKAAERRLRRRCVEDGTPVQSDGFERRDWERVVATGRLDELFCLPERQLEAAVGPIPEPRSEPDRSGTWAGPTAVTAIGPQPGTTVEWIWAREPSALYLVYDATNPRSRHHASEIARLPGLGAARLEMVRTDNLAGLPPVGTAALLNPRAGDKTTSLGLELWRRQDPIARTWDENPPQARPALPLASWLALHVPPRSTLHWEDFEPTEAQAAAGIALLRTIADGRDYSRLDNFAERTRPPLIRDGKLFLANRSFSLGELGAMGDALRPPAPMEKPGGFWFDWCLAIALVAASLDEVVRNYETHWEGVPLPNGRPRVRDELDAITRCGATYSLWSAKTTSHPKKLMPHYAEARAQADRLLGRQRPAILVVPRLQNGSKSWPHRHCCPMPRHGAPTGFAVSIDFLLDAKAVRALASGAERFAHR